MTKVDVNCKFSIRQYSEAISKSGNLHPDKIDAAIAKNLVNIVYRDLTLELSKIDKFNFIFDRKLPITLAEEIINHDALIIQEQALVRMIYKSELLSKTFEKGKYGLIDFIDPFLNRLLTEDEKEFMKKLIPFLKEDIPTIASLFEKKIDIDSDEISEFFNSINGKYGDKKDQLRLLRLFNFLINDDGTLFGKIAHYNI